MHFNVYDVFYSINSHQHVSAATAVIFSVVLLLIGKNVFSSVAYTPWKLKKIIVISVKIT